MFYKRRCHSLCWCQMERIEEHTISHLRQLSSHNGHVTHWLSIHISWRDIRISFFLRESAWLDDLTIQECVNLVLYGMLFV